MSQPVLGPLYLDHSATTPVAPEVLAAMQPYFSEVYGNASSMHSFGSAAVAALDEAHHTVACDLGARASEIVFTGCGTESDNLAIRGASLAMWKRGRGQHLIVASAEHHAVAHTFHQLQDLFGFTVTELPVGSDGRVDPDDVRKAIRPDTVLCSVMLANNEVGSFNDIASIGAICRERGVLMHTDAVQAPSTVLLNVNALNVDLLALSAHKFYGPKGVGMLYIREGTAYLSTLTGGGHERGRRPGTVNVAGCVGLAAASKYVAARRDTQAGRLSLLRDKLFAGILADVPDARVSGHAHDRLAGHASFVFKDVDGETLLMALDIEGIAVSTGSACTSGNPEPSEVLVAMGISPNWALGGLRISLGYGTTEDDVDRVIDVLPKCVARIRKTAHVMGSARVVAQP